MTFYASRNAGTISTGGVSSVNITGTGTAFTAAQVGAKVYFNNGANTFTVATVISTTSITATVAQTIPAGTPFTVDEPGTVGNAGVSSANLTGVGTAFVAANTQSRLDIAGIPAAFVKTVTNGTNIVLDRAVAVPDGSKYQIVSMLVQTGTDTDPSQLLNIFGVTKDQEGGNNGLFTPRITRIQVPYRIRQNGICTVNATTYRLYMSLKNVSLTIEVPIWQLNPTGTLTLGSKQIVNGVSTSASLPAIYFENDSTNWPTDAASLWAVSGSQLNWYAAIESKAICYFEGKIDFGNATLMVGDAASAAANSVAVFSQSLTQSFTGNGLTFVGSAIQNKALIPMSFGITNALARMFQVSDGRSDDINTDKCIDCDFGIYAGAKASVYGSSKGIKSVTKGWFLGTWDVPHTSSADYGAVLIYAKMQFAPKTASGATITTSDTIYVFDEVDNGSRKDYSGASTNSTTPGYVGTGNMTNWLPTTQYTGAIGATGLSSVINVLLQVTTIPYNAVGSRDSRQSTDGTLTYTIKSYFYQTTTFTTNTSGIGTLVDSPRLPADVYASSLTLAQATARQSDIGVNTSTNTLTINNPITLDDQYCIAKKWNASVANAFYPTKSTGLITPTGKVADCAALNIVGIEKLTAGTSLNSIKSAGTVTANGKFSIGVEGNVLQSTPTDLSGVAVKGNLTFNTNTPMTITLTNCTITGTISNTGSGLVTVTNSGSTITTVGANVVTRLSSALSLTLPAGTSIYVSNGVGAQADYVAASGSSYSLDTTGGTGTWAVKVAKYGQLAQTFTFTPATGGTTSITVTFLPDMGVIQPAAGTVAAYTSFDGYDKLYDYGAYFETTAAGIAAARITQRSGTSIDLNTVSLIADANAATAWSYSAGLLTVKAPTLASGSAFSRLVTTGTITTSNGAVITGYIEDSLGIRVKVTKSGGGTFNIAARSGTTGSYVDLGYQAGVSSVTYTVPKGTPVEVAAWSLGCVTYTRLIDTTAGSMALAMEMTPNAAINTALDVTSYLSNIALSLDISGASPVFVITFNAAMTVSGIELGKAIIHRLVGSEVALRAGFPPGSTSTIVINADEITNQLPAVRVALGASVPVTGRVYLDFFINQAGALAINPAYVINPVQADGNQVQILRSKPALDAEYLAAKVVAALPPSAGGMGITLAQIEASTVLAKEATLATKASQLSVNALATPPTPAQNAAAVRAELATELGRIDVATSTRLATTGYTAPANADISAIRAKTDTLVNADLSALAKKTDLPAAPDNAGIAAIKAKTDTLTNADLSSLATHADATALSLQMGAPAQANALAALATANQAEHDATQAAIAALPAPAAPPTPAQNAAAVRTELAAELGRLDAAVSTRLATTDYTAPANADIAAIKAKTDVLLNADLSGVAAAQALQGVADTLATVAAAVDDLQGMV